MGININMRGGGGLQQDDNYIELDDTNSLELFESQLCFPRIAPSSMNFQWMPNYQSSNIHELIGWTEQKCDLQCTSLGDTNKHPCTLDTPEILSHAPSYPLNNYQYNPCILPNSDIAAPPQSCLTSETSNKGKSNIGLIDRNVQSYSKIPEKSTFPFVEKKIQKRKLTKKSKRKPVILTQEEQENAFLRFVRPLSARPGICPTERTYASLHDLMIGKCVENSEFSYL
eukprot:TRINITY_DN616_c0_g1_i1.p1 TRINITY_DN616_c0_g1~~TRINITY_DN616_c0_g1_i1.p1  ORF type:complete len:227 (+),score=18.54 TRINITY_DN616_c0_g1_i1:113-793(+)